MVFIVRALIDFTFPYTNMGNHTEKQVVINLNIQNAAKFHRIMAAIFIDIIQPCIAMHLILIKVKWCRDVSVAYTITDSENGLLPVLH